jgi:hypothetical protein
MPVILPTQDAEIRKIVVQSQPMQIFHETLPQKYPTYKGLVEWLKVKALSSSFQYHKKIKKRKTSELGGVQQTHTEKWSI